MLFRSRASIVRDIGGFCSAYDGAQDYDFVLRFTEIAKKIIHIPKVLYHWRAIPGSTAASMDEKDYVINSANRALLARAERVGGGGLLKTTKFKGSFDLRYNINGNPLVSIIIPIYGKCDYTLRCLHSIAINIPACGFEIIVVDDCSPDNSAEILKQIESIQLISSVENQGFIRSCNIGAKAAKGEYLHFLNNDTEVTAGWLDELVRTFHDFPGTGFVGSKLLYPDGTLQEAGGIIWQDGSAWNFGRYQDASLPIYNYAREVDYCSGASILVPIALFKELNGFDEYFIPAYYEDADLAVKIRQRGYRVIYQPLSNVIHFEGISSGTDINHGVKAYQVENAKKFFIRWQSWLKDHQVAGNNVDTAKDRMVKYRVLVLDHCTPTPNQDAGSVIVFNSLILLREMGFQVTFIPEDNFLYMPE